MQLDVMFGLQIYALRNIFSLLEYGCYCIIQVYTSYLKFKLYLR